jgi:hypothetical protein
VPPSDFRFLSVRATGVKRVNGAVVSGAAGRERLTRQQHDVVAGPGSERRRSVFLLDLGVPNVPVTQLHVFLAPPFAAEPYERPILVAGSNDRESFRPLARGRIFRFRGSTSAPIELQSRFRYLRVTIENGDDPPLRGVRFDTFGPSQTVLLAPKHKPPFRLLYGGPAVSAPSYEFARIPAPKLRTFVAADQLGPERVNAAFEPPADTRSFVERNPEVIQAALALAAAALLVGGFLALRRRT